MDKVLVDIRKETKTIREYFNDNDLVLVEDLLNAVDNLIYEKHCLEEEIEDIKQDMQDNYRPIPYSTQVGISDRDFH